MDESQSALLAAIRSGDRQEQGAAYQALLELTSRPVPWAYDAWDQLVAALESKDNRLRSIAAQLLSNLAAYSDPERRIANDLDALMAVTHDEKFVTARHALQSIWKVGLAGDAQRSLICSHLARRFEEAGSEKNGRLVRYDILVALRHLFDETSDSVIEQQSRHLITTETDEKYRKKYASVWRNRGKA